MSKKLCSGLGFTWSRDIISSLIHLYEAEPSLYKVKTAVYHDRNARNKSLQKICEELNKKHQTSLTVSDLTKKIHGLRTTYFQELNKVKKSECSGTSSDLVYIPKWWCFEMLAFLRDHTSVVEPGSSNMPQTQTQTIRFEEESQDGQEDENDVIFEGDINDISLMSPLSSVPSRPNSAFSGREDPQPKKRQRTSETTPNIQSFFASAKNSLEIITAKHQAAPTSKNSAFGQMLSQEMDGITDEGILDDLKEEIMNALFKAKRTLRKIQTSL